LGLSEYLNEEIFGSNFKLILLMSAVGITILFILPDQTSWAAIMYCPTTATVCNGTAGDDYIVATNANHVIHGLGGNDIIFGFGYGNNYIFRDDGNDILIDEFHLSHVMSWTQ